MTWSARVGACCPHVDRKLWRHVDCEDLSSVRRRIPSAVGGTRGHVRAGIPVPLHVDPSNVRRCCHLRRLARGHVWGSVLGVVLVGRCAGEWRDNQSQGDQLDVRYDQVPSIDSDAAGSKLPTVNDGKLRVCRYRGILAFSPAGPLHSINRPSDVGRLLVSAWVVLRAGPAQGLGAESAPELDLV